MDLYMVTSGQYSAYDVCGIYSTLEKAEHAKKFFCTDNDIETIVLDGLPKHPDNTFLYCVTMNREGSTSRVKMADPTEGNDLEIKPSRDEINIDFRMWAKNEEHAVKIANEYRTGLLSKNLWPADMKSWQELIKKGFIESWYHKE